VLLVLTPRPNGKRIAADTECVRNYANVT